MGIKCNIFQFNDYREILKALIEDRKNNLQIFSYRWFSQRAGLTSPNFLNLVVNGQRHLSAETIEKVIEIFQLNLQEGVFFRNLVHFNKAKTLTEKEHYASLLVKSRKFQKEYPLSKNQFDYYSQWYNVPIRELYNLKDPPKSEYEISQSLVPTITNIEAKQAVEKLKALNLIEKKNGILRATQETVTTGNSFSNYGVVQFHKKMMSLASESLDRFPGSQREVSSVTLALSESSFKKLKSEIESFRNRLMEIAESDEKKEVVYQMNFQLFPISKKKS